jgi:hypothetical protein
MIPCVATALYLELPVLIPKIRLFTVSIIHNTALTLFSGYVFYALSYELMNKGVVYTHRYYFQNPTVQSILWWVYMSKYYEFGDTILLYAAEL